MGRYRTPSLPDDVHHLLWLLRAGRLFDVQDYIRAGRQYRVEGKGYSSTPLRVALNTGFHSMLQVMLKAGFGREELDDALRRSLFLGRSDLVELLLDNGADPRSIPLEEVCEWHDPAVVSLFIRRGAEVTEGMPLAQALGRSVRPMLGVFMWLLEERPHLKEDLLMQASAAMRSHAREGRIGSVCLLLWAGADPHMRVPDGEFPEPEEESWDTPLMTAILFGHSAIVEKFGIDPTKIDLQKALGFAAMNGDMKLVAKLISIGADPNATNDEWPHSAFQGLCWRIWTRTSHRYHPGGPVVADEELGKLIEFLRIGGRFELNRESMRSLRSALPELDTERITTFIRQFRSEFGVEASQLLHLIGTQKLRERMRPQWAKLRDELRGIEPKTARRSARPRRRSR